MYEACDKFIEITPKLDYLLFRWGMFQIWSKIRLIRGQMMWLYCFLNQNEPGYIILLVGLWMLWWSSHLRRKMILLLHWYPLLIFTAYPDDLPIEVFSRKSAFDGLTFVNREYSLLSFVWNTLCTKLCLKKSQFFFMDRLWLPN